MYHNFLLCLLDEHGIDEVVVSGPDLVPGGPVFEDELGAALQERTLQQQAEQPIAPGVHQAHT